MSVEKIILNFRHFLLNSWSVLFDNPDYIDWDNDPYFLDDFMQANWELLVERQLGKGIYIAPYGYDQSPKARVLSKGRENTHLITCIEKKLTDPREYGFICFLTMDSASTEKVTPRIAVPFDFVCVREFESKEQIIIALSDVDFGIVKV